VLWVLSNGEVLDLVVISVSLGSVLLDSGTGRDVRQEAVSVVL